MGSKPTKDGLAAALDTMTQQLYACKRVVEGLQAELNAARDGLFTEGRRLRTLEAEHERLRQELEVHHGYYKCVAKVDADAAVAAQADFWQRERDALAERVRGLEALRQFVLDGIEEWSKRDIDAGGMIAAIERRARALAPASPATPPQGETEEQG